MKTSIRNLFLLPVLVVSLSSIPAERVTAQTFTTLHSFSADAALANSDGRYPSAVILSDTILYGTAFAGGTLTWGTVFKLNADGTGFRTLRSFSGGSDGSALSGRLVLSGNVLYGTAQQAGSSGDGTVFKLNTDGTGFSVLHSFSAHSGAPNYSNSDGFYPEAGLILSGGTLYGAASDGGSSGSGTVFSINTNGTGFTVLHSFAGSDGNLLRAGLILSGNTLYGTAYNGGSGGGGTVFSVNTNGTGFAILHSFDSSDGAQPSAALVLSDNTLYGTTAWGGSSGYGTVFSVNTDGTGFTTLYSFSGGSDGANPFSGPLILSGSTLYGTARNAGASGAGTVFNVNTDGTGFAVIYSFSGGMDGFSPGSATLSLSGNILYGVAGGGTWGNGMVFSLSLPVPPQLTIIRSGANVILTWPTDAAGFILQTSPDLTTWNDSTATPVVVGAQNTITNDLSANSQFYRLKK